MAKACSDTVINPVSKPSEKKTIRIKIRKVNDYEKERSKFLSLFYKICGVYGANYFENVESEKKYAICASEGFVYPMLTITNFGDTTPYFPDEHSAEMAIEKLGKDRLLKYWFSAEEPAMTNFEYMKSLSPEKLSKFLIVSEWCDSSCAYDGGMRSDRCAECLLKWLNSKRKEDEICDLPF